MKRLLVWLGDPNKFLSVDLPSALLVLAIVFLYTNAHSTAIALSGIYVYAGIRCTLGFWLTPYSVHHRNDL